MKKVILILIAVVLTFCLLGCEEESETSKPILKEESETSKPILKEESETSKPILKEESNENIYIWTDKETGVQYVVYYDRRGYAGMGGITPRLNADGTLYTESEDTE